MRYVVLVIFIAASVSGFAQRNRDRDRDRSNNKVEQEDLSLLRPKFTIPADTSKHYQGNPVKNVPVVKPVMMVNEKVDFVLDSIDRLNSLKRVIPGYTIQVYSGLNREEAGNARKRLVDELEMRAELQYIQPKVRVRVGYYFTSINAQKDLHKIKRVFPNAILIPESVPINKK